MAIIFFDGFERRIDTLVGSEYPWRTNGTSATSPVRTGDRSLDGSDTTAGGFAECRDFSRANTDRTDFFFDLTDAYLSFYLYLDSTPSILNTLISFYDSTFSFKGGLRLQTSRILRWRDSAITDTDGSTALSLGEWYRIDVHCPTGTSSTATVKLNGTTEITASGGNHLSTTSSRFRIAIATSFTWFLDDLVLADDAFHADGSDYRVESIFPDGNGNYTAWTGDFNDVDEKSHDATSTEITTDNDPDRETVTLESIGTLEAGATIDAVKLIYHMRKTANAATNVQIIDRVSSTDRDTASFGLDKNDSDDLQKWWEIYTTAPGGGSWAESDVNGLEMGLEHNQSQTRDIFCTVMNANVLITEGTAVAAVHRLPLLGVG